MDIYYEEAVATWLVADGRTLIAPQYPVRINAPTADTPVTWPDILAVRPKDKEVFLCEVSWSRDWTRHCQKFTKYRDHRENIHASLEHWLGVGGEEWQLSVWYFVPEKHVEKIEGMMGCAGLPLKVTALESIKPWTYAWGFRKTEC